MRRLCHPPWISYYETEARSYSARQVGRSALFGFFLFRFTALGRRRLVFGIDHRTSLGVDVHFLDARFARNLELIRVDQATVLVLELDRLDLAVLDSRQRRLGGLGLGNFRLFHQRRWKVSLVLRFLLLLSRKRPHQRTAG